MNKAVLAIATAFALSMTAGPLFAGDNPKGTDSQAESGTVPGAEGTSAMPATMADEGSGTMGVMPAFDDLDENSDGEVDENELNAYGATAAGQSPIPADDNKEMMEKYDRDMSGSISEEEWAEHSKKHSK